LTENTPVDNSIYGERILPNKIAQLYVQQNQIARVHVMGPLASSIG